MTQSELCTLVHLLRELGWKYKGLTDHWIKFKDPRGKSYGISTSHNWETVERWYNGLL